MLEYYFQRERASLSLGWNQKGTGTLKWGSRALVEYQESFSLSKSLWAQISVCLGYCRLASSYGVSMSSAFIFLPPDSLLLLASTNGENFTFALHEVHTQELSTCDRQKGMYLSMIWWFFMPSRELSSQRSKLHISSSLEEPREGRWLRILCTYIL